MAKRLYSYCLKTTHPSYPTRSGLVLEMNNGFGEIAPLPGFSKETFQQAKDEALSIFPHFEKATLPSVRFAHYSTTLPFPPPSFKIPLCAFYKPRKNFSTLKLKLGHLSLDDALSLTKKYVDQYLLRLDFNRKWDLEKLLVFTRHFSPTSFDYLEEPLPSFSDSLHFSKETNFPIAIDESFSSGNFSTKHTIIKPTIIGTIPQIPHVVLSSSFESSLGLLQIARHASPSVAAGLDTFDFFEEDLLTKKLEAKDGFLIWNFHPDPIDRKKLCLILDAP